MYVTSYHIEAMILGCLAAVVAFCALLLVRNSPLVRGGRWKGGARPGPGDVAGQLRHVAASAFFRKKVMNKSEYRIFRIVEAELKHLGNGCRALCQTSLGEVIGSEDERAFAAINSKRVDILIIGPFGDAVAAIEYQGGAHHQGTAAIRDAIKREALRKAGVEFIEITESHSPLEVAGLVRRLFAGSAAVSPSPGGAARQA